MLYYNKYFAIARFAQYIIYYILFIISLLPVRGRWNKVQYHSCELLRVLYYYLHPSVVLISAFPES